MTATIVGIGHESRAGKDTAGRALCRDLGFRRLAFADVLKELAMEASPLISLGDNANHAAGRGRLRWIVQGLGWEQAKDFYPEVRAFLERLGTGARHVFGEDFWTEQVLKQIRPGEKVVITDVRFSNEAEMIRERGGMLIKINRPSFWEQRPFDRGLAAFDGWHEVIGNTSSIPALEDAVVSAVERWMDAKHPLAASP